MATAASREDIRDKAFFLVVHNIDIAKTTTDIFDKTKNDMP